MSEERAFLLRRGQDPQPAGDRLPVARRTYSIREAAEILGVGKNLLYDQASRGAIPCLKIGRRMVIPHKGLLEMLGEVEPAD